MAQNDDETARPSQAEGESTPDSSSSPGAKSPRPSQAEGEAGQTAVANKTNQTEPDEATNAAVSGRSRVQHGDQFRAGQSGPAADSSDKGDGAITAPRPSQAEGELDSGSTDADKAPRPSQAEGEKPA